MKTPSLWTIATGCFIALTSAAQARSAYDGSWDLVFVTQRGACESSYNFTVNVSDGIVSHPNLLKFRGRVARSGVVHASVTVHDNTLRAPASSRAPRAAGCGTAAPAAPHVQAIGLLNAIERTGANHVPEVGNVGR